VAEGIAGILSDEGGDTGILPVLYNGHLAWSKSQGWKIARRVRLEA